MKRNLLLITLLLAGGLSARATTIVDANFDGLTPSTGVTVGTSLGGGAVVSSSALLDIAASGTSGASGNWIRPNGTNKGVVIASSTTADPQQWTSFSLDFRNAAGTTVQSATTFAIRASIGWSSSNPTSVSYPNPSNGSDLALFGVAAQPGQTQAVQFVSGFSFSGTDLLALSASTATLSVNTWYRLTVDVKSNGDGTYDLADMTLLNVSSSTVVLGGSSFDFSGINPTAGANLDSATSGYTLFTTRMNGATTSGIGLDNAMAVVIPEPSVPAALALGLLGLAGARRRRE
jgi:hypothetical protein